MIIVIHGILATLLYSKGNDMGDEARCGQCKFYHSYTLRDSEGNCRRRAPICSGQGLHSDMTIWPKVYGISMWCGEFVDKDSKEVTP